MSRDDQDEGLIKLAPLPPQAAAPPSAPPGEKLSVGGFLENVLSDGFETAKGIGQAILFSWPRAAKAGYDILSDPEGMKMLWNSPEHLTHELKETGKSVVNSIIEPYVNHPTTFWYHRPIGTLLDALTIIDAGAGTIGKVGKLAGSERLVKAAEALRAMPMNLAGKAADKIMGKFGIDRAARKETIGILGRREAQMLKMSAEDEEKYTSLGRALKPEEHATFDRFLEQGYTHAEASQLPHIAAAVEQYRPLAKMWKDWHVEKNLLTEAQAQERLHAGFALSKYKKISPETMAQAAADMEKMPFKPIYRPHIHDQGPYDAAAHAFQDMNISANIGRLETFKGMPGYSTDPKVWMSTAVRDFRKWESRIEAFKEILANPKLTLRAVAGEGHLKQIPTYGTLKKYLDNVQGLSQQVFIRDLMKKSGIPHEQAVAALLKDPEMMKVFGAMKDVEFNPTTLRILQHTFYRPAGAVGMFLHKYDTILNWARSLATRWNPKWHLTVAAGTPLLAIEAGMGWGNIARAAKYEEAMPFSLRVASAHGEARGMTPFSKFMDKINFSEGIKLANREGVYDAKLAELLTKSGEAGFDTAQLTADVMRQVSLDAREYRNLTVQLQTMGEAVASRLPEVIQINQDIAELGARLAEEEVGLARVDVKSTAELSQADAAALRDAKKKVLAARSALERQEAQLAKHGPTPEVHRRNKEARTAVGQAEREFFQLRSQLGPYGATPLQEQVHRAPAIQRAGEARAAAKIPVEEARQKLIAAWNGREQLVADIRAREQEIAMAEGRMPELAAKSKLVEQAEDWSNRFFSNYLFLGPIERQYLRRLVPFFTWMKSITSLAFSIPFLRPKSRFAWNQYANVMNSMVGDPALPDYMAPYFPLFAKADGSTVWVRLGSFLHAGALHTEHFFGVPIPGLLAFWRENPFINLIARGAGLKDEFSTAPIAQNDPMVSMADGSVYTFDQNGKLQRTLQQPSFMSGLMHMFPQAQWADALISNWEGVPPGLERFLGEHLGFTRPLRNPDGSIRYPHALMQNIVSALVVPVKVKSREDIIRGEQKQVNIAIRQLQKEYRRAPPDRQEMIRQVLGDYQQGLYHRMKAR